MQTASVRAELMADHRLNLESPSEPPKRRAGGSFDSLYAIRSGFFKSSVVLEDSEVCAVPYAHLDVPGLRAVMVHDNE